MRRLFAAIGFLLVLVGCDNAAKDSAPQFSGIDITGADYGKALKLTDHTGKVRTLQDFKGKVVLVFFGFTQCPEICPTTLHDLANEGRSRSNAAITSSPGGAGGERRCAPSAR